MSHREEAAEEVQKLMRRGALTAALGFIVPLVPNVFSIAFFVRAYDRSGEEFWKRKGLFAIGAVCNLVVTSVICFTVYTGYIKMTEKAYGLLAVSCFKKTFPIRSRISSCNAALGLTHDKDKQQQVRIALGALNIRLRNFDDAIAHLEVAAAQSDQKSDQKSPRVLIMLELAKALKSHSAAQLDEIVKAHPGNAPGYFARCLFYGEEKKFILALGECTTAVQLQPAFPTAREARGFVELTSGNTKDALLDYNAAISMDAKRPASFYGRGQAKISLGDKIGGGTDVLEAKTLELDIVENFGVLESLE